jgi:hypothetical protein
LNSNASICSIARPYVKVLSGNLFRLFCLLPMILILARVRIWLQPRGASRAAAIFKRNLRLHTLLKYGTLAWPAYADVPGWDVKLPATSQQQGLEPSIRFNAAYKVLEHILVQRLPIPVLQVRRQTEPALQYDLHCRFLRVGQQLYTLCST